MNCTAAAASLFEPFFSRLGIDRIEAMIIEEVNLLDARLKQLRGLRRVVRLDHVFAAFAGDVIGRILCETPPNMMKQADFGAHW